MNIGIIGAGNIGATSARLFAQAGHEVAVSNSRGAESLASTAGQLGRGVRAASVDDAAAFGEAVLVAIPLKELPTLPAKRLAGKIVIDAMNYYPRRDGQFPELDSGALTSSEMAARFLPDSRLVKAFNTMYFETLANEGQPSAGGDDRLALFVAGDDLEAKRMVMGLIEQVGFAAVDTGGLRDGGLLQQAGGPLYNVPMTADKARQALRSAR